MIFEMNQYEVKYHEDGDWQEISEIRAINELYKAFGKVTPTIKEMIMGKEVETPDGVHRLKIYKKATHSKDNI